jgi:hypothetical protein
MMIPEEISFIVSSDPSQGASNRSASGSYFEVQLQDGISIPQDALNVNLSVQEATVWWTVSNINTGENDTLVITGPDTSDNVQTFTVVIPQGLYDLGGLNQAIMRELENQDAKIDPSPLVTLTGDEPTSKVEVRLNYDTVTLDLTGATTPRDILGFNSQVIGPFAGAPETVLGDNIASFNQINYFLLHSDLTTSGIRLNNAYNQTVSQILIDVSPGSQIVSKPFNPAKIGVQELAGVKKNLIRVWLTDDKNRRINTNGEYFTARMVLSFIRPYVIK